MFHRIVFKVDEADLFLRSCVILPWNWSHLYVAIERGLDLAVGPRGYRLIFMLRMVFF